MNVEIICVGTELLLGDILNTNAKFLSERIAEMGFNLFIGAKGSTATTFELFFISLGLDHLA